jgi:hypothetical protein
MRRFIIILLLVKIYGLVLRKDMVQNLSIMDIWIKGDMYTVYTKKIFAT